MATECEIRPARAEDGAGLLSLIQAHAEFEGGRASISEKQLDALLAASSPPTTILLASGREALLGYAAVTVDYALWRAHRWGHLDCLFVHSHHRGQSIGRLLLDAAARLASRLGADRMEWQTPDWNVRAAAFYAREGATAQRKLRFTMLLEDLELQNFDD